MFNLSERVFASPSTVASCRQYYDPDNVSRAPCTSCTSQSTDLCESGLTIIQNFPYPLCQSLRLKRFVQQFHIIRDAATLAENFPRVTG
jgi:hypothetical protein